MNRIPFLSLDRRIHLSPTSMGYPLGYADFFFPNAFLHLLFFLGYVRSLIIFLFRFLGLSDLLEAGVVWPDSHTSMFDDRSVSTILIQEFLPVVKFADIVAGAGRGFLPESCVVCLCDFEAEEEVRCLKKCKHIFHRNCLDRWMVRDQRSCPLCRAPVVPDGSFPHLLAFPGCSEFSGDYS